jgi:hypothetical protein
MGRDRTLLLVACKKWHVGKRLAERIRDITGLQAVAYAFNEADTPLPNLGGIETSLDKRSRHRRALLRLLFETSDSDRLVLCVDPASIDVIRDLHEDRARVRLLEIVCTFSDTDLIGHARRVGLAGPKASDAALERLLPTIRTELASESARLGDLNLPGHVRCFQSAEAEQIAEQLALFLGVTPGKAREIMADDHLFAD